jgi:hypothetical protein
MGGSVIPPINFMEQILTHAVNEAVKENPNVTDNMESLMLAAHKKFIEMKLADFPRMCQVARVQNKMLLDELRENGNTGKFTGSSGWSNDGTFKWEFTIPSDLYLFMKCLVYKNFWSQENKKVHRAFMNAICRGDDPMTTLMKVKTLYGSNKDVSLIT